MNFRKINLETTLFILAFLVGLLVRFFGLGNSPLSESEATWALQALQISQPVSGNGSVRIGSQPAYVFLTAVSFMVFNTSTFMARFWPALAGSFLVLLPTLARKQLGRPATIILAFGLAIDPGLVTVSRQAGGPMLALAFGLLAWGFWSQRSSLLAGVFAGLALLSGPALITGMLGLGLAWALMHFLLPVDQKVLPGSEQDDDTNENQALLSSEPKQERPESNTRRMILAAVATLLIVGTFFFHLPQGLGAWFNTLPDYLMSWVIPSGFSASQLLVTLVVYQPFALIFALVCVGRWIKDQRAGNPNRSRKLFFMALWSLTSLLISLIYPARQPSDLIWVLVPVWILASIELNLYLPKKEPLWTALLEMGLIILLAILFWNTLIATNRIVPSPEIPWTTIQIAVLIGIVALGALTTILIGLGWSWEAARFGLIWGLALIFTIYAFSGIWGATQLRANQPQELWNIPPGTGQAALMRSTLEDLSNWNTGLPVHISVVSSVESASLRWLLRDFSNVQFTDQPPVGELPDVIITRQEQEIPALSASYRGQDFVWWVWPGWQGSIPRPFMEWVSFRKAPLINEHIILWARSDLFPGGMLEPVSESPDNE